MSASVLCERSFTYGIVQLTSKGRVRFVPYTKGEEVANSLAPDVVMLRYIELMRGRAKNSNESTLISSTILDFKFPFTLTSTEFKHRNTITDRTFCKFSLGYHRGILYV